MEERLADERGPRGRVDVQRVQERGVGRAEVEGVEPCVADRGGEEGFVGCLAVVAGIWGGGCGGGCRRGGRRRRWEDGCGGGRGLLVLADVGVEARSGDGEERARVEAGVGTAWERGEQEGERAGW